LLEEERKKKKKKKVKHLGDFFPELKLGMICWLCQAEFLWLLHAIKS
jgi:hypothetical protein